MKNIILFLLALLTLTSCDKEVVLRDESSNVCDYKTELLSPSGFELNTIGNIDFNGGLEEFQFINDQIGFALLGNNVGGYVEVFKTTDGGLNWADLDIGIDKYPRNMVFKDENFGIITVHAITGCPLGCQNKCVVLKTENGGQDWEEVEYEEFKGKLTHPKYDSEGNLYANLSLKGESTLLKSVDDAEHWEILYSSDELGFDLVTYSFEIFQDKIFISGKDGKILVIDTEGQLHKTIKIEDSPIWDVEIIDENNLIVVLSGKVIKSTNGGDTWETIYENGARMIGFESIDKGLMMLNKSYCPSDVLQSNDLIATTNDGGHNWTEAEETTTNLRPNFEYCQKMGDGIWFMMIDNELIEIKEN